jgi:hypothetical protein
MHEDPKQKQINSILSFDFSRGQGSLIVNRDDIRAYVKEHGMLFSSLRGSELGYGEVDGQWYIEYYDRGLPCSIEYYSDLMEALEIIMDFALASYTSENPWNPTHA